MSYISPGKFIVGLMVMLVGMTIAGMDEWWPWSIIVGAPTGLAGVWLMFQRTNFGRVW